MSILSKTRCLDKISHNKIQGIDSRDRENIVMKG